jgi:hypothetical protein
VSFWTAILQPIVPFVQYYYFSNQQTVSTDILLTDCDCSCNKESSTYHKPTGDAYLKALLKRVCYDQKKESPKLPVVNISVFIQKLYDNHFPVFEFPEQNYNQISDFIILPPLSSHSEELFRPPRLS